MFKERSGAVDDVPLKLCESVCDRQILQVPEHPDYFITESAIVISFKGKFPKFLKPQINSTGRCQYRIDGRYVSAARLIAITFHPIDGADDLEADHIDGDKLNDHRDNIQWLSKTDNIRKHHNLPLRMEWRVRSPTGDLHVVQKVTKFAREHAINRSAFGEMLNGSLVWTGKRWVVRKSVQGWRLVEAIQAVAVEELMRQRRSTKIPKV